MEKHKKEIEITLPKGRPMLYWAGKKAIEHVKGYPCQLVEVYGPYGNSKFHKTLKYEELEKNWHNLLFEGDNKDVLATLLENGFRGKIALIYIDPPFASKADYVRKVQLRGLKNLGQITEDDAPLLQQVMYEDMWKRDEYFQFMYERLLLMKELLAEHGSFYLHLDYRMVHYLRTIMDEIFGQDNFVNQIIWNKGFRGTEATEKFQMAHDVILFYTKNKDNYIWNQPFQEYKDIDMNRYNKIDSQGRRYALIKRRRPSGAIYYGKTYAKSRKKADDVISIPVMASTSSERTGFETQKPLELLNFIIQASSDSQESKIYKKACEFFVLEQMKDIDFISELTDKKVASFDELHEKQQKKLIEIWFEDFDMNEEIQNEWINFVESNFKEEIRTYQPSIILDCFIGSGTTAESAQRLGRRWIGVDINKGAIQLTAKRVGNAIQEQLKEYKGEMVLPFAIYKVNNYDLRLLKTEAKELAIEHLGIERIKTDRFFDGKIGNRFVKIIDFNYPLTPLDLQTISDEIKKRPKEDRDITVVCLGKELYADAWLTEWNKKTPVNKIEVVDLKTDPKSGGFIIHEPARAKVTMKKIKTKAVITIKDFISPTIAKRLEMDMKLFKAKITDFRSMIDYVLIDPDYGGKVFKTVYSDIPVKRDDLIKGEYEIDLSKSNDKIAIKIVDMLGEEVLVIL